MTSSREPGIHWVSSTQIMCSWALCECARLKAAPSALEAPSEPSLAIRIFLNMGVLLGDRLECRLEPALGDDCRHDGAGDHGRHQDGILLLVDDVVGQPEQG